MERFWFRNHITPLASSSWNMQHSLLERNCQLAFIIIIIIILFYLNPTYNQSTLPVGDSHKEKGKQIKLCWTEELKVKMIKVLWWRKWLFSLGNKNGRRALSDGGDTFRVNPSQWCCLLAMSLVKLPTLCIGCELPVNFWLSLLVLSVSCCTHDLSVH